MKIIISALVTAILTVACSNPLPVDNQLTGKEKKDGWQLLFDGQTMNGWRRIYTDSFPKAGWRVENGCLMMEDNKGKESANGGDLITIKEYGDFDFTFDFKLVDHPK